MAILPHLKIGKLRDFYSDDVSRSWVSGIKDSGLVAHDGEALSYKRVTQGYLDKNIHLYAKVLGSVGNGVLEAARKYNSNIDSQVENLIIPKKLEDMRDDKELQDASSPESEPEKSGSYKSFFSMKKLAITTALATSIGAGVVLHDELDVRENLKDSFENTAYSIVQPENSIERCVVDGIANAAANTIAIENSAFNLRGDRHDDYIWDDFRRSVLNEASECQNDHAASGFKLSGDEIQNLASSFWSNIKQEL